MATLERSLSLLLVIRKKKKKNERQKLDRISHFAKNNSRPSPMNYPKVSETSILVISPARFPGEFPREFPREKNSDCR